MFGIVAYTKNTTVGPNVAKSSQEIGAEMLIVCTKDSEIISGAQAPDSGADQWGGLHVLDKRKDQPAATTELKNLIGRATVQEPICLSAHGNDQEIGDPDEDGWGWDCKVMAELFGEAIPKGRGPILIRACAKTVANFSPGLAIALQSIRRLNGVWVFSYNKPLPISTHYPSPSDMGKKAELQGSQVNF